MYAFTSETIKELEQIALNNSITLKKRRDLEDHNRELDNYSELRIWGLRRILAKAYYLGLITPMKTPLPRTVFKLLEWIAMDDCTLLTKRGYLEGHDNDAENFMLLYIWDLHNMIQDAFLHGTKEAYRFGLRERNY